MPIPAKPFQNPIGQATARGNIVRKPVIGADTMKKVNVKRPGSKPVMPYLKTWLPKN